MPFDITTSQQFPVHWGSTQVGVMVLFEGALHVKLIALPMGGSENLEIDVSANPSVLPETRDADGHLVHWKVLTENPFGGLLTIGEAIGHSLKSGTVVQLRLHLVPVSGLFRVEVGT